MPAGRSCGCRRRSRPGQAGPPAAGGCACASDRTASKGTAHPPRQRTSSYTYPPASARHRRKRRMRRRGMSERRPRIRPNWTGPVRRRYEYRHEHRHGRASAGLRQRRSRRRRCRRKRRRRRRNRGRRNRRSGQQRQRRDGGQYEEITRQRADRILDPIRCRHARLPRTPRGIDRAVVLTAGATSVSPCIAAISTAVIQ